MIMTHQVACEGMATAGHLLPLKAMEEPRCFSAILAAAVDSPRRPARRLAVSALPLCRGWSSEGTPLDLVGAAKVERAWDLPPGESVSQV